MLPPHSIACHRRSTHPPSIADAESILTSPLASSPHAACTIPGAGVGGLMKAVITSRDRWRARVPTAVLNRWLRKMVFLHPPPRDSTTGGACSLKYLTQVKRGPPEFRVFVNHLSLPADYQRCVFGLASLVQRALLPRGNEPGPL